MFETLRKEREEIIRNAVRQLLMTVTGLSEKEVDALNTPAGPVETICDAVEEILFNNQTPLCRPYYDENKKPCYLNGTCHCKNCPMKAIHE